MRAQGRSQADVAERPVKAKPDNNGHDQINLDELLDVARYKKSWKDNIDRRFVSIFLVSLFFNIILVMYLSHLPLEITTEYARKIQEHYARFIYEKEPEPAEEETQQPEMLGMEEGAKKEQAKAGAGKGEAGPGKGAGEPAGQAAARARREAHRKSTQEIAQEVSSKGVLGLLTGTGSAARGEEVADILGELGGGASENLDEVLSGISGIKSSGQPSGGKGRGKGGARGSRVTGGGGGIGDMVAALTQAQTREVGKRTQKLVVSQSSVKAEGGKSAGRRPEDVLAVINSHRAAIEYCYQRALRRNPNLRGKISVRFVIRPDGSVKDVKIISSTLNDPRVERCIVAKIRSWRDFGPIDPSKGDAVFRQDFIFGY